jgi:hypothetical protein
MPVQTAVISTPANVYKPAQAEPGSIIWQGSTTDEVNAPNAPIYATTSKPATLVLYELSSDQQFWCKELDRSYTLRTMTDIMKDCQPGE